ncbi:MAG: flagellar basal body-associated FliL family protein [Gammaproteobacteria bacterium]|nr:flagellar basal body-associated FliL family protein [Gammaproteobacteria bacterium]
MPLDEETEAVAQAAPVEKPKGNLLKIIIIVLSSLLVVGGSVAATLYFAGVFSASEKLSSGDEVSDKGSSKPEKERKNLDKEPAIYFIFESPFVVNFIDKNQIRYLQINVEVMSRDQEVIDSIGAHLPKIKNNFLVLFSDLDFEMITNAAGKQKLRELALEELRNILKDETGNNDVEALYFTGFVMQ